MKRPRVEVTVVTTGTVIGRETRRTWNAGVRASEAMVRKYAHELGETFSGDAPVSDRVHPRWLTVGDSYRRRWVGDRDGCEVYAVAVVTDAGDYGRGQS